MAALIWGWDTANTKWVKALVDSLGHLQVDTLSTALPPDAATGGRQDVQTDVMSLIRILLAARLPAALDTLALKVREQGTPEQHIYGISGSTWYSLLVESATYKNLRVAIYSAGGKIAASVASTAIAVGTRGLVTESRLRAIDGGNWVYVRAIDTSQDNRLTTSHALNTGAYLFGFDGTYWDRLRTYGTGILKVGRAAIGATLARETGTGGVASGVRHLFWICVHPSAANWLVELTDTTIAGQTVVYSLGGAAVEMTHHNFDPPIEFATGIYLETLTNCNAVHFSYV